MGGVGMRRGRRDPEEVRVGDAVDFWRVEAVEPGRLLRLRAEMKVPGRAWLEFKVEPRDAGSRACHRRHSSPRADWRGCSIGILYPMHAVIFSGLVKKLALLAQEVGAKR